MSRATKPHVESQGTRAPQSTATPALMWPYLGQGDSREGGEEYTEVPGTNPSEDPYHNGAAAEEPGSAGGNAAGGPWILGGRLGQGETGRVTQQ